MDTINADQPAPRWFPLAAIAILLWELLGAAMFVAQLRIDPALLDSADRAVLTAAPQWMIVAYGVAVTAGVIGAILLLARRRRAELLLMISLVAVVVQDSAYLLSPGLRNLTASDDLFLPFVILLICYSIWHFARSARASGWLR